MYMQSLELLKVLRFLLRFSFNLAHNTHLHTNAQHALDTQLAMLYPLHKQDVRGDKREKR